MSFGVVLRFRQRAKRYLDSARDNFAKGRYDVATLESEIAAQLLIKAYIAYRGYAVPRVHHVRELISIIINNKLCSEDVIDKLRDFVKKYRKELIILERAREAGQYGFADIDENEAKISLEIVDKIFKLFEEIW